MIRWELYSSAAKIVSLYGNVKPGEKVLVIADTPADRNVVDAIACAARASNAETYQLIVEERSRVDIAPTKLMFEAMKNADVVFDLLFQYITHTQGLYEARKAGARVLQLTGIDEKALIRLLQIDVEAIFQFGDILSKVIRGKKMFRVTTPSGTDVVFENDSARPVTHISGRVSKSGDGSIFPGQSIAWASIEQSINGTLVSDGFLWPPDSLLPIKSPVTIKLKDGKITDIVGGIEAKVWREHLKSLGAKMFDYSHWSVGFHPTAGLASGVAEAERYYGCFQYGFGTQNPMHKGAGKGGPGHTDGASLNATMYGDDEPIMKDGRFVHPDLIKLDKRIRG